MRIVRGFGMATERERRQADLFYAALVGRKPRRQARPRSEAHPVEAYEQQTPPAVPYLPTGGRDFVPQAGTFNCTPAAATVVPASFLPSRTDNPGAVLDQVLTDVGLNATRRRQVTRAGLIPIAREFGREALRELFARLRWSPADIARWGNGARSMLVPRLLLHIPGHFRELARRAPDAREAFVLECLGWLIMRTLRDSVAGATRRNWWLPPAPTFVTAVPNPIPFVSRDVLALITRYLYIDTRMTAGQWNSRLAAWGNGLPGRQWRAEVSGPQPGLPFYASLVNVPAFVNTAATRRDVQRAWTQRRADVDARFPPDAAGATNVTLSGLQNAVALVECDDTNPHLPAGVLSRVSLQGLELAYQFPITRGQLTLRRLRLMRSLHPVFSALCGAIRELGWNDLLFQCSGAACFRGIKHTSFPTPSATVVQAINQDPERRATVLAACQSARTMSQHSAGAAVDMNYHENKQGERTRPFGSMDPRLVSIFEAFGFQWGACFPTTDPHHFEYCQTACAPRAADAGPTVPLPSNLFMPPDATGTMIA